MALCQPAKQDHRCSLLFTENLPSPPPSVESNSSFPSYRKCHSRYNVDLDARPIILGLGSLPLLNPNGTVLLMWICYNVLFVT